MSFIRFFYLWQCLITVISSLPRHSKLLSHKSMLLTSVLENVLTKNTDKLYDTDAFNKGFVSCSSETCEIVSNSMPLDLEGTYFRNGPGKFEVGKDLIIHPFDGDGMLTAITISNSTATFRNRFVATKGYLYEKKAKKISYRGVFSTKIKGGPLANIFAINPKHTANTNVIYWAGRLLALWEGGLPYRLEPDSLRTVGAYTLKGLLKKSQGFSAHPKVDTNTGRLVTFSTSTSFNSVNLKCQEFDPKDFSLRSERLVELPGVGFFHDFVVTKNYYIFHQPPAEFEVWPFLLGMKCAAESLKFNPQGRSKLIIVPRDPNNPKVETVDVDPHFVFHYANGFERSDGSIVWDGLMHDRLVASLPVTDGQPIWQSIDYEKDLTLSLFTRCTLTPKAGGGFSYSTVQLSQRSMDFPAIHPLVSCRPHRFVYTNGAPVVGKPCPYQGLVKIDTSTGEEVSWFPAPHEFIGEPCFVPKRLPSNQQKMDTVSEENEDSGYVLALLNNGQLLQTELVVFDAKQIEKGPISRSLLPVNVPSGLHGTFADGLVFDPTDILRRFTAVKALDSRNWNEITGGFSGLGISYDM